MPEDAPGPVDLSAEAALELEELRQGFRDDVPALFGLLHVLRTPSRGFQGAESLSMLADARAYTLFRDVLKPSSTSIQGAKFAEAEQIIEQYLRALEAGVRDKNADAIAEATRFCLALNQSMLARSLSDLYSRREQSDLRYIANESLPQRKT